MFLRFANFYQRLVQGFSKIAEPLILMLKTTPTARIGTPPKAVDDSIFLTSEAKLAFLWLKQAFTKTSILHLDPNCYIQIETNAFDYVIGGIFIQLTPDSGQ